MDKAIKKKIEEAEVIELGERNAIVWMLPADVTGEEMATIKTAITSVTGESPILFRGVSITSLVDMVNSLDEGMKNKLRNELK